MDSRLHIYALFFITIIFSQVYQKGDYVKNLSGNITEVLITPETSDAANYAFDVTPNRLVTGLITERGVSDANSNSLKKLFPEKILPD